MGGVTYHGSRGWCSIPRCRRLPVGFRTGCRCCQCPAGDSRCAAAMAAAVPLGVFCAGRAAALSGSLFGGGEGEGGSQRVDQGLGAGGGQRWKTARLAHHRGEPHSEQDDSAAAITTLPAVHPAGRRDGCPFAAAPTGGDTAGSSCGNEMRGASVGGVVARRRGGAGWCAAGLTEAAALRTWRRSYTDGEEGSRGSAPPSAG